MTTEERERGEAFWKRGDLARQGRGRRFLARRVGQVSEAYGEAVMKCFRPDFKERYIGEGEILCMGNTITAFHLEEISLPMELTAGRESALRLFVLYSLVFIRGALFYTFLRDENLLLKDGKTILTTFYFFSTNLFPHLPTNS